MPVIRGLMKRSSQFPSFLIISHVVHAIISLEYTEEYSYTE